MAGAAQRGSGSPFHVTTDPAAEGTGLPRGLTRGRTRDNRLRILAISSVVERQLEAMLAMEGAQGHLVRHEADLPACRESRQSATAVDKEANEAEAYQRAFPSSARS